MTADSPSYPPVLFFHLDSQATVRDFFRNRWPEAHAVADPERRFYDAFGLRRGSLGELLGLGMLARAAQAMLKGNRMGRPTADARQMPGMLLVDGDRVVWEHAFGHVGDYPDLEQLGRSFARMASTS